MNNARKTIISFQIAYRQRESHVIEELLWIMAQGKLKVKQKVPDSVAKKKKQQAQLKKVQQANSKIVKRPKNPKDQLAAKIHKEVQKKINSSIETELASRAQRVEEGKSFKAIG